MAPSRTLSSAMVLIFLLFNFSEAKVFLVGGKTDAWKTPSSQSESLNKWAEASRFQVGDSLVWNYESGKDSVLEVKREDYLSCNTSSPIAEYKDGKTNVKLDRSGPYYFISGASGHCEKGQKVIVVVLSKRLSGGFVSVITPAPAPSPMEIDGPAVAPTSGTHSGLKNGLMVMMLGSLVGMMVLM